MELDERIRKVAGLFLLQYSFMPFVLVAIFMIQFTNYFYVPIILGIVGFGGQYIALSFMLYHIYKIWRGD